MLAYLVEGEWCSRAEASKKSGSSVQQFAEIADMHVRSMFLDSRVQREHGSSIKPVTPPVSSAGVTGTYLVESYDALYGTRREHCRSY